MSEFRRLVEQVKLEQACGEDVLDEGWGKTLGTLATAAAIGMGVCKVQMLKLIQKH